MTTVSVGHVVIPQALSEILLGAEPFPSFTEAVPRAKKQRTEGTHIPEDVVEIIDWSVEGIRCGLGSYAHRCLPSHMSDIEELRRTLPWPFVVPPSPSPPSSSGGNDSEGKYESSAVASRAFPSKWVSWRFSFLPHALHGTSSRSAASDNAESALMHALASLPLPRGFCFTGHKRHSNITAAVLREPAGPPGSDTVQLNLCSKTTTSNASFPAHGAASPLGGGQKPLLLVGAGGIGCEVLKVLVLSGFTHIYLIDLDTIDATNLNRQFLFQAADVGMSKAETARRVVLEWMERHRSRSSSVAPEAPLPCIVAHHTNIKDEQYDDAFFTQFAAVLNALDNVSARQHVNRMCMRNHIPLIESGTMGYNGQVQPILKGQYECYDCRPKPPDTKTFAVCTIHARPSTMVHCVHYAKELYEVLFGGGSSNDSSTAGAAPVICKTEGENGEATEEEKETAAAAEGELAYLSSMVSVWRHDQSTREGAMRDSALSAVQLAEQLLRQLFVDKIEELLVMKASWSTEPPLPLPADVVKQVVQSHLARLSASPSYSVASLSVDDVLSLPESMALFLGAVQQCLSQPPGTAFAKENDVAVRFVSATANLRAAVFHIAMQSLEDVRSIAGSIVPAIATTNAIIAAAVVHELFSVLALSADTSSEQRREKLPSDRIEDQWEARPTPQPQVVYARKVPQQRRRRLLSTITDGGDHAFISPSLYLSLPCAVAAVRQESWEALHLQQVGLDVLGLPSWRAEERKGAFAAFTAAISHHVAKSAPASVMDNYLVHSTVPNPPNAQHCVVCHDVRPEVSVFLDCAKVTLGQLVRVVLEGGLALEGASVSYGATVLYEDEDYEVLSNEHLAPLLRMSLAQKEGTSAGEGGAPVAAHVILSVDALNKEVAWSIVLTHKPASALPEEGDTEGEREEDDVPYLVSGLEKAVAAEAAALERLKVQQAEAEETAMAGEKRGRDAVHDGQTSTSTAFVVVLEEEEEEGVTSIVVAVAPEKVEMSEDDIVLLN